jgi:integral membrane sensor domain MASE1
MLKIETVNLEVLTLINNEAYLWYITNLIEAVYSSYLLSNLTDWKVQFENSQIHKNLFTLYHAFLIKTINRADL